MPTLKKSRLFGAARSQVFILSCFVALMWATECVNFFLGGRLNQFGILPREVIGLRGIVFAPFLHADFAHLIANTIPFICLGWVVLLRGTNNFFTVTLIVMLIGGLGTWLISSAGTVHIGASGVVFGYLGFLMSRGYFERSLVSIVLSIVVGFFYGGYLWGVLPGRMGISWQGHLFGFMGGVLAARYVARKTRQGAR